MKRRLNQVLLGILIVIIFLFPVLNKTARSQQTKTVNSQAVATENSLSAPTGTPSAQNLPTNQQSQVKGIQTADFCLNVPILLYHHIQPYALAQKEGQLNLSVDDKVFETQMAHLASSGYQTISIDELVQALLTSQNLPPKSIAITADDGYEDIYTYAFPIIRKYNLKMNLMIPTGLMDNTGYLRWSQLKEMIDGGLVFVYNHTWSHASLAQMPEEKIRFEISTAKKQLEDQLGKTVNIFAYPYGSTTPQVEKVLRDEKNIAALSTSHGFTQCRSFIMNLHRNHVGSKPLAAYGL